MKFRSVAGTVGERLPNARHATLVLECGHRKPFNGRGELPLRTHCAECKEEI